MKTIVIAVAILLLSTSAYAGKITEQVAACTRAHGSCLQAEKDAQKDILHACADLECRLRESTNLIHLNKLCNDAWGCCYDAAHGGKLSAKCAKLQTP